MPLINGIVYDLELPSEKHARVIGDTSHPWRYRVLHGGRNGYKDWSFAAAAIERGVRVSTRFLFTREVQLTIADSAHQLLKDTINRLGYTKYFDITNNKITCKKNDTSFIFRGLNDLVSEDVKSTEGIDVCVICEAQNLTLKSMGDLDPTIRKKNSEIWIMFNTKFDTDYVYQFCVVNPPENMICERVTYLDAPARMLSDVVRDQAENDKATNIDLYNNKWLGLPLLLGQFFSNFGRHNSETPFIIPEQDDNTRIFGSLDHGISHFTSFGLWYLDPLHYMHRILTYKRNGLTTKGHAENIVDIIEACRFTRYLFPCEIFYDYAMDEMSRKNEREYRSDLDEYKDVFKLKDGARNTRFIPANKRKVDGCHAMKGVFDLGDGLPVLRYFEGLNDDFVDAIKAAEMDDLNAEIYKKQDGDDPVDECRYGVMGINTKRAIKKMPKSKPFILTHEQTEFAHALA